MKKCLLIAVVVLATTPDAEAGMWSWLSGGRHHFANEICQSEDAEQWWSWMMIHLFALSPAWK